MSKVRTASKRHDEAGRGQVLVVFALSLITLLGFAGLALDGGSTFAQKRSQQTAADLAALAAANDYLVNGSASLATSRAGFSAPRRRASSPITYPGDAFHGSIVLPDGKSRSPGTNRNEGNSARSESSPGFTSCGIP